MPTTLASADAPKIVRPSGLQQISKRGPRLGRSKDAFAAGAAAPAPTPHRRSLESHDAMASNGASSGPQRSRDTPAGLTSGTATSPAATTAGIV